MRRRLALGLAAGVLLAGAGVYLRQQRVRERAAEVARRTPRRAFPMCVAREAERRPSKRTNNDALLGAVARTLEEPERASLEEALTSAAIRWEARANPMLDDLEDGDPDAALEAWFKKAPKFVRTAQSAAQVVVCAPDGFCVTPRMAEDACPAGFAAPEGAAEDGRSRFLGWPWGHAWRFRARSAADARASAEALRARLRESKRVAIVMTADDVGLTKVPPYAKTRELWGRVAGLRALAKKEPSVMTSGLGRFFGRVEDEREIVVLPHIGSVAEEAALVAEVLASAPLLDPAR